MNCGTPYGRRVGVKKYINIYDMEKTMQAYEGYIENGQFVPIKKVARIPGKWRAVLTILDEQIKLSETEDNETFWTEFNQLAKKAEKEDRELRAAWLSRLHKAVEASLDEVLPDIPRSMAMREPIDLRD